MSLHTHFNTFKPAVYQLKFCRCKFVVYFLDALGFKAALYKSVYAQRQKLQLSNFTIFKQQTANWLNALRTTELWSVKISVCILYTYMYITIKVSTLSAFAALIFEPRHV